MAENLAQEAISGTLSERDFTALQSTGASTSALGGDGRPLLSAVGVRSSMAQALFAGATADAAVQSRREVPAGARGYLERVASMLETTAAELPGAAFDETLQLPTQWPLPDELAFTAVATLLKIGSVLPQVRARAARSVQTLVDGLVRELTSAPARDLVVRTVPALHGVARAVQHAAFPWDGASVAPLLQTLGTVAVDEAGSAGPAGQRLLGEPREPDAFRALLQEHYAVLGVPLSGPFIAWCALSVMTSMVAQGALGERVLAMAAEAALSSDEVAASTAAWTALVRGERVMQSLPTANAGRMARCVYETVAAHTAAAHKCELLSTALKLSVLADVCDASAPTLDADAACAALSERAPLYDAALQRAAVEAMAVLAHAQPTAAPTLLHHVRDFVQLPLPLFQRDMACGSPLLAASARSMASCIDASQQRDLAASSVYAMLNRVSTGGCAAAATITAVADLARALDEPSFTVLVVSLLLQRLDGTGRLPVAEVLVHLVPLALRAPRSTFVNVMTAFADAARAALRAGDGAALGAVQSAQLLLARGLTAEAEHAADAADAACGEARAPRATSRKGLYLRELLALVIEAGLRTRGGRGPATAAVRGQLPVLAALLAHDDVRPQLAPSDDLVYLFRNVWVVVALTGVAGTLAAPMPRGEPLNVLALKTPTLIPASARNYLADDIACHTILAQDTLGATPDSVRRALSPVLGARAADARGLSLPQLAFVQAVLEVEWRRAACGRPAAMLTYLGHAGVAESALVSPLRAVAERAFSAFLVHVADRTESHTLDAPIADEVRALLVGACHRLPLVRDTAHGYLERLAPVFPDLFVRRDVLVTMLELLALLAHAANGELEEAYMPRYTFVSRLAGVTLEMQDGYAQRKGILVCFLARVRAILARVQSEMPHELSFALRHYVECGGADGLARTVALEFAGGMPTPVGTSAVWAGGNAGAAYSAVQGAAVGAVKVQSAGDLDEFRRTLAAARAEAPGIVPSDLRGLLFRAAAVVVYEPALDFDVLWDMVLLPFALCTKQALTLGTEAWAWIMAERPGATTALATAISHGWTRSALLRRGLYSAELVAAPALARKTDMSATNPAAMALEARRANDLFAGHMTVAQLLLGRLHAVRSSDAPFVSVMTHFVQQLTTHAAALSHHPLARLPRLVLVLLSLRVLAASHLDVLVEARLRDGVCRLALDWFAHPAVWSFGGDLRRAADELRYIHLVQSALRSATLRADSLVSCSTVAQPNKQLTVHSKQPLIPGCTLADAVLHTQQLLHLLQGLYATEAQRLTVWLHPTRAAGPADRPIELTAADVHVAWAVDARVAVELGARNTALGPEVARLVRAAPHRVVIAPDALVHLVEMARDGSGGHTRSHGLLRTRRAKAPAPEDPTALRWLALWAPVSPIEAIGLLPSDAGGSHGAVLQYAMRVLDEYPVDLVFFYVPQIVQALRDDPYGYVEHFILQTSAVSQLFCHQIIWNMKANTYKDDNGEVEDALKPTLDRMIAAIVDGLSGEAQEFYEREFRFFNEVTSISGKLRPFIKKSKPEKKAKIDEEMHKIQLEPDVYLPSNPDGVVVDLDRRSGRPLQSAAKAPFMATFRVRRPAQVRDEDDSNPQDKPAFEDVWQGAIFKVGDDCRQDVLALQVIAQFKNIFACIGLDVYLDPYRVTATGPGCGVIDVVPNATSRDEMGRQKINDLRDFFLNRYGDEQSVSFQKARLNFIQSMAAYSVACHILQIRDRHNGNIMIDGEGHLVHIDFGFLFDIGPGGMRFEPYSFKLSHEMVAVMGGPDSPGFRLFEQLVVKAFLACRPYVNEIVATCGLMLGTELPSFKGKPTLERLRERFKPDLTEREAALHAQWLVKDAYGNMRGTLYDLIQEKQNSIPYRR